MNIFLRKLCIIIFVLFIANNAFSQTDIWGNDLKNHFFTGGGLNLQVGSQVNVGVEPVFGYHISNIFSVGISGSYQYYYSSYNKESFNIYGGRAFMRIQPIQMLFLHGEYEVLTYKTDIFSAPTYQFETIVSENVLVGVGYSSNFSERLRANLMLLFNLNNTIYTPYSNPVLRASIEWAFPACKKAREAEKN